MNEIHEPTSSLPRWAEALVESERGWYPSTPASLGGGWSAQASRLSRDWKYGAWSATAAEWPLPLRGISVLV